MTQDDHLLDAMGIAGFLLIPEFRRSFFAGINDTGSILAYIKAILAFRKSIVESDAFKAGTGKESMTDRRYWFELVQMKTKKWVKLDIQPTPTPDFDKSQILPQDLIDDMGKTETSFEQVEQWTGATSKLTGLTYHLRFMHPSKYTLCGVVWPKSGERKEQQEAHNHAMGLEERIAYQTLFTYMERFPALKMYFFNKLFYLINFLEDGAPTDTDTENDENEPD